MLSFKERVAPFVALLDARYLPLLAAAAPQAYAVYRWLWVGSDKSTEALIFAILGAVGFEMVYVGAIAWTEYGQFSRWTWFTAVAALVFSTAVAVYVYSAQGAAALLHAGFPVVAFAYTMAMHKTQQQPVPQNTYDALATELQQLARTVNTALAQRNHPAQPTIEVVAPAQLPDATVATVATKRGKLPDGATVQQEVAASSKQAVADRYGVSRQAVDKKLRGA